MIDVLKSDLFGFKCESLGALLPRARPVLALGSCLVVLTLDVADGFDVDDRTEIAGLVNGIRLLASFPFVGGLLLCGSSRILCLQISRSRLLLIYELLANQLHLHKAILITPLLKLPLLFMFIFLVGIRRW